MCNKSYLAKKEDLDGRNSEIEKLDTESEILLQLIEWMKSSNVELVEKLNAIQGIDTTDLVNKMTMIQ